MEEFEDVGMLLLHFGVVISHIMELVGFHLAEIIIVLFLLEGLFGFIDSGKKIKKRHTVLRIPQMAYRLARMNRHRNMVINERKQTCVK